MTDQNACGAHDRLSTDLRATARLLLDRVRTAVQPLRDGEPPVSGSAGECRACPVCAVLAVLRGERSELAAQLAEHAAGLVTVLAAVLDADDPADAGTPASGRRGGSGGSGDPASRRPGPEPGSGPGRARAPRPEAPESGRIRVERPDRRPAGATDARPSDARSADPRSATPRPADPRSADPRSADARPADVGAAATAARREGAEQVWSGHSRHTHPRVPGTSGRSVQRIAVHRR